MTRRRDYRRLLDLGLGGRARTDAEMDLEIESHLAMRAADLVRAGWTPDAARQEAMRRFASAAASGGRDVPASGGDGGFDDARHRLHVAARHRDASMRQRDRAGAIVADLRCAVRQARRAPGFTALATAALAIGIGATTTMFTLTDHVLLRPLPFAHPEQLVRLAGEDSAHNSILMVSSADWVDWRRATRTMAGSAIYGFRFRQGIVTNDSAVRVDAVRVSGDYFAVLGARFVAGRPFTEAEVRNGQTVVVISEALWRRVFGADSGLTTPLRSTSRSYRIVGVVAAGNALPAETDLWIPAIIDAEAGYVRNYINWYAIGRLRPGATREQARVELTTASRAIRVTDPAGLYDFGVGVASLGDSLAGKASEYLTLLTAVVGFVLLIVCANVAAAGLARAEVRSREMAIRASLGAMRGRLVQQLIIEHVVLGLFGGVLGLFVAWAAVRVIVARWGAAIPRAAEISVDGRVFLFALGASLVAGTVAGMIPALRASRTSLTSMMASGGRTSASGGRNMAGAWLVGAEIALAFLLLTGAGLLIRSFRAVLGHDIGFDTNVATAEVGLSGPAYSRDSVRRYAYWSSLIDSYRAIPGVDAAAVANWIPLGLTGQGFVDIGGRDVPGAAAVYRTVSDDFFRALRMPMLSGRTFDGTDGPGTARVALINRTMATKYWPGEDPIGKQVRAASMERRANGQPADWLTIIGVVGDVRTYGLESDPMPELYALYRQTPSWTSGMIAIVHGAVPATQLFGAMRQRAREIDPRTAVDVGTLDDRLRVSLSSRVMTMTMLSTFAAIALVLAGLGIYGVLSYAVAQRTRELAVRAALGASRGGLLWLVLRGGLRVVAAGMAVGIAAACWLMRALQSMLVDVGAMDPATVAAAVLVLLVVAVAAIMVPAARATRLDPLIALQPD